MICADGWLCERDSAISLELQQDDSYHVKRFADWSMGTFSARGRGTIYSKTAFSDLVSKGVGPRKSHLLDARVFEYIPDELMNHFVRGWFDGDGSVYKVKKSGRFGFGFVGTKAALERIQMILVKIGLSNTSIGKHKSIFDVKWVSDDAILKMNSWLYQNATIWLERKRDVFEMAVLIASVRVPKWTKRKVRLLDDGREFDTIKEAAEVVGGSASSIQHCCAGHIRTSHGFRWSYV
jgi:hypothetical protein